METMSFRFGIEDYFSYYDSIPQKDETNKEIIHIERTNSNKVIGEKN